MSRRASGQFDSPNEHGNSEHAEVVMSALEETVALFFRLRAVLEDIHGHSEISGSMRGVMRDLYANGPQTVPQMARRRPVSRQHIQAIVNDLQRAGLVTLAENPRHKRSRLVQLTALGERELQDIFAREHAVLNEVEFPVSVEEIAEATAIIARVRHTLESNEWRDTVRTVLYQDGETPRNPWIDDRDDDHNPAAPIHRN
jgi:DNA-binding MarR family transcriptional regulator